LNSGHNFVADSIQDGVARLVNALGELDATFLNEKTEDRLGEGNMLADEGQILSDRGGMVRTQDRRKLQRYVNGKDEGAADGGDAAKNVGAMNGSAIPCIARRVGSRDPNERVVAIISSNGDGFVEEPEVTFNADCFVVALGGGV
jgi:hypothetical protein